MEEKVTQYTKESYSYILECPYCGKKTLIVNEIVYNLPGMGDVLLISKNCSLCGYRHNEIFPLKKERHRRIYIRINSSKDLKTKIIRSSASSIEIPEIKAKISPGIIAPMFITNIEGVLERFLDTISRMDVLDISDEKKKLEEIKEKIERMKKGYVPFTVIIDDPWGISGIYERRQGCLVVTEYIE